MADDKDISASLSLDISAYERNVSRAIRDATQFEGALDDVIDTVNKTDKALSSLNTDIKLSVETDTSAIGGLQADLDKLDTKLTPLVDVDTGNLSAVKGDIAAALSGTFTPKLNVDDSELTAAKRKIGELSTTENVKVDVTGDPASDPDIQEVKEELQAIKQLAVIELAVNLAGSIPSPSDIPILNTIIEADTAARNLQATLGAGFRPTQAQEAQDLYTSGFGATQTEAAQALATVVQTTGNEFKTAAESGESFGNIAAQAFTVADLSGEDFNAVLDAADKLYASGQVDSYAEGLDLIAAGFQNGLNNGADLLDTVREYSPQFEQLGFTSGEFFNSLKAGMDAGAYNTDFIADLIKEMNIRAQAAMAGEGAEFDALQAMGLLDEAEAYAAGEITGKAYAEAVAEAAEAGLTDGSITPQTIFDALGTKAEDLTIPVTLEILGTGGEGIFGDTAGISAAAGEALYGGIETSVETAKRLVETELAASIDEAFDIQGKIDSFNDGIKEFSALIAGGEDIPAAIEKAFNLDGFAETFARFESAIGNLVLEVSTLIANVLEATGNTEGAESVRGGIEGMAADQLAFDLKLQDDGAGIQSAVQTAIRRGVDDAALEDALTTAGRELIAEGDLVKAQQFVQAIQTAQTVTLPTALTDYLSGKGIDPTNLTAVRTELEAITSTSTGGLIDIFKSPIEGMGALDFENLISSVTLAEQAQTAAAPIAAEFETALFDEFNTLFAEGDLLGGLDLAQSLGLEDMASVFQSELSTTLGALPDVLEEQMLLAATPINNFQIAATTALDSTRDRFSVVAPEIATSIATGISTPVNDASTAITTLTTNVETLVPVISDQLGVAQDDMGATGEGSEQLAMSVDSLNTVSLGGLMGQFAALRASAEDQLGYINLQLALLQGALAGLAGFSIDIPGIAGRSGGAHMYGGVIPAGTVGTVHGGEMLAAAPQGTDIAVLNQQTTSTIEAALASLVGGGAGGGSVSNVTYNNNFIYNVQSNAQGFMSEGAARSARGF